VVLLADQNTLSVQRGAGAVETLPATGQLAARLRHLGELVARLPSVS
jgi:hypothetical protein